MSDDARWANLAFGVYDFFAYLLPAILLVSPALLLPSDAVGILLKTFAEDLLAKLDGMGATASGTILSITVAAALVYVMGLVLHSTARFVERTFLDRTERALLKWKNAPNARAPSGIVLVEAKGNLSLPLPDLIRSKARAQFGLSDSASDEMLWELAYRYLAQRGSLARTMQFLFLHNLTRGLTFVGAVWFIIFLAHVGGPSKVALFATVVTAVVVLVMNNLRRIYNRAVAEEVFLAYYVLSTNPNSTTPD